VFTYHQNNIQRLQWNRSRIKEMKFRQTWVQWSVTDLWELVGCDDEIVGLARPRRIYHRPTKVWDIRPRKVASQTWYQRGSSTSTQSTISALSPRTTDSPPVYTKHYSPSHAIQEGQLSQRDRATLRVIEYFAKSLKITQGHSKWHCSIGRV